MRRLLISILLASAAASPALAQDRHDRGDRGDRGGHEQQQSDGQQTREDRRQAREDRAEAREQFRAQHEASSERAEPARVDRPPLELRRQASESAMPQEANDGALADRRDVEQFRETRRAQRADGTSRWTRDNIQQPGETERYVRDPSQRSGETSRWTRDRTGWTRSGDLRQSDRPLPNVMRTRNPLIVSATPREGTQPPLRSQAHRSLRPDWSAGWRHDHRYDWRHWRDRHRSLFRIGVYYDPFGWSYRPYQIGWRLWPSYYGRRFRINDPYEYRLPYAPAGTVWVRYWDDALLVDTWTGEVIDVIHNFFW
jgi:Ni/Co efflux regulator RcnB